MYVVLLIVLKLPANIYSVSVNLQYVSIDPFIVANDSKIKALSMFSDKIIYLLSSTSNWLDSLYGDRPAKSPANPN